jgi:hypothetical protein
MNFGALTCYLVGTAKDALINKLKSGRQIPCSGDLLGNLQTQCTLRYTGARMVPEFADLWEVGLTGNEVQPNNILLKYAPGDTITGESVARSTTAYQTDASGIYVSKAINTKRDGHFVGWGGAATVRTLLLEDARTNSILWSRDLTNAAWTGAATPLLNAVGLDGSANSATTLTDNSAVAFQSKGEAIAVPNDSNSHAVAVWVKKDAVSARFVGIAVGLSGGTAVSRSLNLNTQTGAIGTYFASVGGGSHRVIDAGLWWIVEAVVVNNTTGNVTLTVTVFPAVGTVFGTSDVAAQGSCIVGQIQIEKNASFCSSPIFTTTAAVTRGADGYNFPFTTPPQEMTAYAKFVELGTIVTTGARVFDITGNSDIDPRFLVESSGAVYGSFYSNALGSSSFLASAPPLGNTVELLGRLFGDGSVDIIQSINGAASTASIQSVANPLVSAWAGQLCWLNGAAAANTGFIALQSLKIVAGMRSLAEMQAP